MLKRRRTPAPRLPDAGEIVTVRAYEGSRAAEEPRALVIDGTEVPVDAVDWRASVAEGGRRLRVFVVRAGGARMRLAYDEDSGMWTIERHLSG